MLYPAKDGIRVEPRIADEMRTKAAKAAAAKDKKATKKANNEVKVENVPEEKDEFDMMCDDKDLNRSLSEKLGFDLKKEKKATKVRLTSYTRRKSFIA